MKFNKSNICFFKVALNEAKKAFKNNEVPVGAVIVKNNKIIAKAYNQREKQKSVVAHAEILAIKKASKKNNNWRLNDCDIYTTLEPCEMCLSAIKQSRIKNIFYILQSQQFNYEKSKKHLNIFKIENAFLEDSIKDLVKNFFIERRKINL
ncbi:MAG: nucleoside deaminase [Bacilli bacterium]|nr:nucleoside deaminase [Bacilli bacterium]